MKYVGILPKDEGRAQHGMFSFSHVVLNLKCIRSNRARPVRASETSRIHEPNGAFFLCVFSRARVLRAFSLTLTMQADIT